MAVPNIPEPSEKIPKSLRSALMLITAEKILFISAAFVSVYFALRAARQIKLVILRGSGSLDWPTALRRIPQVILDTITFAPVFRHRKWTSLFHGLVAWGFLYYILVNLGDILQGFLQDFHFLGDGTLGEIYRLGADLLSVAALAGMFALLIRRLVVRPGSMNVRESTLLHPKARRGVQRDSIIVGLFILLHVGSRFIGESFHLAARGADPWQPLASSVASLWIGWSAAGLELSRHLSWWLALGSILAFIPYFLYSKHLHLIMAPINGLFSPERRSIGELDALDFEDESIEQFGAERLEDLPASSLLDAYACIMCNRCQDACPAYATGKVLSPAAMEINKRYFLNQEGPRIASGEPSSLRLLDFAISAEAVWACTACGACVDVCPVGNDPMRDILDIRRHLVLMENAFPDQLQAAFRGMERTANPWNLAAEERVKWMEGRNIPTLNEQPDPEILWWVGCAPATDPRAQKTAVSFAKVLEAAGVRYAVLGAEERCTGDSARRAGNEYLFYELAASNIETLNQAAPKRIVTTCPHCLHTLKNEYPAFGGDYLVIHHTELIEELIETGRLVLEGKTSSDPIVFHDPCYLGRHNDVYDAPRDVLRSAGIDLSEMLLAREDSFCCGAGGAQMWKEEEAGNERVSTARIHQAQDAGAETLAVGCPFCMIMFNDAVSVEDAEIEVRDVAEIVADRIAGR
jgi:Fe-S oxidoreductase